MTLGELWSRSWPLVFVLAVAILGWLQLSEMARTALDEGADTVAASPTEHDFDKAKEWGTALLGLAGAFAGFLGIAAASQRATSLNSIQRARSAEGGMVGVLGGATLLGVGEWAVPVALAVFVTGSAVVRVVRSLKE